MKKRIRTHTNPLNITQRLDHIDISQAVKDYTALNLEIGFGKGVFMSGFAKTHSEELIVGVEVRKQAVEIFNANHTIKNCYPVWGAGQICLEDIIPDGSLKRAFIFHPDPWFKKRHHKRRVINDALIDLLESKMAPNGIVYISTDVYALYNDIMSVLLKKQNKQFISGDDFWQTGYKTHWSQFSNKDLRSLFTATFKFKES